MVFFLLFFRFKLFSCAWETKRLWVKEMNEKRDDRLCAEWLISHLYSLIYMFAIDWTKCRDYLPGIKLDEWTKLSTYHIMRVKCCFSKTSLTILKHPLKILPSLRSERWLSTSGSLMISFHQIAVVSVARICLTACVFDLRLLFMQVIWLLAFRFFFIDHFLAIA